MSVFRVIFLGTPDFAKHHLEGLVNDEHFQVVGVVSQPDRPSGRNMRLAPSPVKKFALEKNLKVITPDSIKDPLVLKEIASWKAEAAVVVAYGQIVPQAFLDLFPGRVVNVHGSLLPRWRGAAPIQRAVEAGDTITGVCLQVMVKKLDAGDVIAQYSFSVSDEMNALDVHDAMIPLGKKLLSIDFMDYLRGNIFATPQDEAHITYAEKIDKSEAKIDWQKSAQEVHNHVRAMVMGPGSYSSHQGKKIKILKTRVLSKTNSIAGEILELTPTSFVVACKEGAIEVLELQPESRSKMTAKEFLLGANLKKGDRLL